MLGSKDKSQVDSVQRIRSSLRRNLTYYPDLGIVYLANARAGSNTFLGTLWNGVDQKLGISTLQNRARDHKRAPAQNMRQGSLVFSDPKEILSATFFSVVRHPLSRLVSAFLTKIGPDSDIRIWKIFCNRYSLSQEDKISFGEFVEALAGDSEPYKIDVHFRPQTINIAYGFVPFKHIGQLENLEPTEQFLRGAGIPGIKSFRGGATDAVKLLGDFYNDPAILKRACDFLAEDFTNFGYEPDVSTLAPIAPVRLVKPDLKPLRRILRQYAKTRGRRLEKQSVSGDMKK